MSRLGTALVAAVALLSVAACTGEEPADGDPSATPRVSATPSATATPTPPPLPPEANEHSADGAAAFVEYWIAVFNYAATTGDTKALDAASDVECLSCQRIIRRFAGLRDNGGHSGNPNWQPTVTSSQLVAGTFHVMVDITSSDYMYKRNSATPEGIVKAAEYRDRYQLRWTEEGWVVHLIAEQQGSR